jgi:hypothetical protein
MSAFAFRFRGELRHLGVLLLAAGILAGIPAAFSQTISGSIRGRVSAPNGAAISGATITIRNLETGWLRQTATGTQGDFESAALPEGRYSLAAAVGSAEPVVLEPLEIAGGQAPTQVAGSSPSAQVQATVSIDTDAPVVDANHSELDKRFTTHTFVELPGRRSLTDLAVLERGVVPNDVVNRKPGWEATVNQPARILSSPYVPGDAINPPRRAPGAEFSVNGARPTSNYFTIDGGYNMDPVTTNPRQDLPPEAIQELSLKTSLFPADEGRGSGGLANQLTRTGTNKLHGTLMYTWNGNSFDALTSNQKRTFEGLRTGGLSEDEAWRRSRSVVVDQKALISAGYPVWRNKVFGFTSWDRDWFNSTWQPRPILAVSPTGLANLRAARGGFAPGALDFFTRAFPEANDPTFRGGFTVLTPSGRLIDVPLQQFNRASVGGVPYDRDYWRAMQRFDLHMMDKNSLSLRYLLDQIDDPGLPAAIAGQEIGQDTRNHSVVLNDAHIFSPTTMNEFRVAYGRLATRSRSNLGMGVDVGGFNVLGNPNFPQRRRDNSWQFTDTLGFAARNHSLKVGFDVLYYQLNSLLQPNSEGTLAFASLEDLLLNRDALFTRFTGTGRIDANPLDIAAFVQDDWKIGKSFALNLGVRYDIGYVPTGFFQGARRDTNNWTPRFGFAWSPGVGGRMLERTVIRGGYGIVYDSYYNRVLLPLAQNFPRGVATVMGPISAVNFFTAVPTVVGPDQFTGNTALLPTLRFATDADSRIEVPYHQQYALGLERMFGSFAFRAFYVGSIGVRQLRLRETNPGFTAAAFNANPAFFSPFGLQPVFGPTGLITAYRTDPSRGSALLIEPTGRSIYNSGQFSLEKRYSAGIQLGVHYTYSSYITDADSFGELASNPFDLRADRARSIFDQPHRIVGNYILTIPQFAAYPFLTRIVSGWQISGATTAAAGMPYSILTSSNALGILPGLNTGIFGTQRAFPGLAPVSANTGVISTLGRNTERMPWVHATDMAFAKSIKTFSEHQALQFRAEVFNVFNRKNFTATPFNILGTAGDPFRFQNFGQSDAIGRSFMFTARYFF